MRIGRRALGVGIVVVGVAMIGVGAANLGDSSEASGQTDRSSTGAPTTTEALALTTTAPPPTTTPPTSTSPTTAPTISTTATTPPPSVDDFILAYAAATVSGDSDFLFTTLLPDIHNVLGADTCRTWIETEILALSNYSATGAPSGPSLRTLTVGVTTISVDRYYEVPITFSFQGESFDAVAAFAIRDGQVFWIGECR